MLEKELQELLIHQPDLIEECCTFIGREVKIGPYRCDLLFRDRNGQNLYVEIKLKVDDRSVGQLLRYHGLVNQPGSRFMLAGLTFVHGLKEGLTKLGYEYKEIVLTDQPIPLKVTAPPLTRGEKRFDSAAALINSFNDGRAREITRSLFEFVDSIHDTHYYLSNGIMFVRNGRSHKFISITTVGNRLLLHVPVSRRDQIYNEYSSIPNLIKCKREKNQIEIKLNSIVSLDQLKRLILCAYNERE